ncbi:MAG: ankyrin repeat domain-containing protein [Actinomycetaceae bacterium]|nr:ankyrin repeat domain-containing protein [Actinomycetaceae bacterium]
MTHYLFRAVTAGNIEKVRKRLDRGDDIEYRHKGTGRTCLVEATIQGHYAVAEFLLDHGADVNASCHALGYTSLTWAIYRGDLPLIQLLIARGADINRIPVESSFGFGAVHQAIMKDNVQALGLLVDNGADLSVQTHRGEGIVEFAQQRKAQRCLEILEALGVQDPEKPPAPEVMEWPALRWDPATLHEGDELPIDATPVEVVYSYITAIWTWESQYEARAGASVTSQTRKDFALANLRQSLKAGSAIAAIHFTSDRNSQMSRVGYPPRYTPAFRLVSIEEPRPRECLVHTRAIAPTLVSEEYEWRFKCVRKNGRWRIASAKYRHQGTNQKWEQAFLP